LAIIFQRRLQQFKVMFQPLLIHVLTLQVRLLDVVCVLQLRQRELSFDGSQMQRRLSFFFEETKRCRRCR
jgi:hypothetical protein